MIPTAPVYHLFHTLTDPTILLAAVRPHVLIILRRPSPHTSQPYRPGSPLYYKPLSLAFSMSSC